MTAAALAKALPDSITISRIESVDDPGADLFFGNVAPPSSYGFNLEAGVTEPQLILDTETTLSWGTKYLRWGAAQRSWIQCFHLPLPVLNGVQFQQYLSRTGAGELEPFLAPAVAARTGTFAHPLADGPPLLSRGEYGYQFDPLSYQAAFANSTQARRVHVIRADLAQVECDPAGVAMLHLADGSTHSADLYVDCTGPKARLLSRLGSDFIGSRRLNALMTLKTLDGRSEPVRTVTARDFGWQSTTTLQNSVARLTLCHPDSATEARMVHADPASRSAELTLGRRIQPWKGNCVAMGHAGRVVEPLTPAPMLLLQRDIERLLTLIPISTDMRIESREFNRQADADHEHAELFNRALFEAAPVADSPYWRDARETPRHEKLVRKIELFQSRGVLATYDNEPFNEEDWLILHYGMGRVPLRHDRVADQIPKADALRFLSTTRRKIESLVAGMPRHHKYVEGMIGYLKKQSPGA
jgi:tryptophan halogenase